jgi:hypothetical protein
MVLTEEEIAQVVGAVMSVPGVIKTAKKPAKKNFEKRMVAEYVLRNYKTCPQWRNARVGDYKEAGESNYYAFLRRWADAIVIDGRKAIIIEGKVKANPGVISQLQLYMREFPRTPEFSIYKDYTVKGLVLCVFEDVNVQQMAEEVGIEWITYRPSFYGEILEYYGMV